MMVSNWMSREEDVKIILPLESELNESNGYFQPWAEDIEF